MRQQPPVKRSSGAWLPWAVLSALLLLALALIVGTQRLHAQTASLQDQVCSAAFGQDDRTAIARIDPDEVVVFSMQELDSLLQGRLPWLEDWLHRQAVPAERVAALRAELAGHMRHMNMLAVRRYNMGLSPQGLLRLREIEEERLAFRLRPLLETAQVASLQRELARSWNVAARMQRSVEAMDQALRREGLRAAR